MTKKAFFFRLTLNLLALAVLFPIALPIFGARFKSVSRRPLNPRLSRPTPTLASPSPSVYPSLTQSPLLLTPTPSSRPTLLPSQASSPPVIPPVPTDTADPWGVAKQIGEYTWTMKVNPDPAMATPQEILAALNTYRRRHGASDLTWDQKLADYAQSRAAFFAGQKELDSHQGFQDYLENQNGFDQLGFTRLGENASYGYRLNGTHLIEWIFAGDKPHDDNQKDTRWGYVGIGIKDTAVCLIFGTGRH